MCNFCLNCLRISNDALKKFLITFFSWFDREHLPINLAFDNETFNPFIFASEEETATSTTYAIAPWTKGPFFGVGPAHKIIRYRDVDFYQMKDGKIL